MKIKVRNRILKIPLLTIILAGTCLVLFYNVPLTEMAVYDRKLIMSGEIWRLLTGNLVHFSIDHLVYNFIILLVAGYLVETRNAYILMLLTLAAALAIGLYLLAFAPEYEQYGGMSGILSAYLVYFSGEKIISTRWTAWPWMVLLLLFFIKIAFELSNGTPFFVTDADFRVASSVHIIGGLVGLLFIAFSFKMRSYLCRMLEGRMRVL